MRRLFSSIDEALCDLKNGKMIIVIDDEDRENEGDLVALAEYATPEIINFMVTHGKGLVCVPLTIERAKQLDLPLMVDNNTDTFKTAFTVSVDSVSTHTGISVYERFKTIKDLIDPTKTPKDFKKPGHIFPLIAYPQGVLRRAGHTEAAVDLAKLCNAYPAGIICEILKEDGTMARVDDLLLFAKKFSLKIITIEDLISYRRKRETLIKKIVEVNLPTSYGDFKARCYLDIVENKEHIALIKGTIDKEKPVMVRVHSECLTGDVFCSKRCDCGPQLKAALKKIAQNGSGVLLYMRQEGRGIGLINKLKAYKLQEEGLDTVEANLKLGFKDDLRDYGIGAQILKDLNISKMRLLTNNPRKIAGLKGYDLEIVEVLPLEFAPREENMTYMKAKKDKLGHFLHYI